LISNIKHNLHGTQSLISDMGSSENDEINTSTPKPQPRTPANAPARPGLIPKAATTTKARHTRFANTDSNQPPESSISSLKPRKTRRASDCESQTTLTQINYVRIPPNAAGADGVLDYITEDGKTARKDGIEVIDLETGSSDGDAEYRPSNRRTREARTRRVQQNKDRPGRDKSTGRQGVRLKSSKLGHSGKKATRSGGKSKSKEAKGKNKTLTQMDFVRRFIIIDDSDDDRRLDYIEHTPKHPDGGDAEKNNLSSGSNERDQPVDDEGPRKKRKLNNGSDVSLGSPVIRPSDNVAESPSYKARTSLRHPLPNPATPQKRLQKLEVPSSQTPESPSQIIIPSPQLRNIPRFPLQSISGNTVDRTPEKEKQTTSSDSGATPRPVRALQLKPEPPESSIAEDSQRSLTGTINCGNSLHDLEGDEALHGAGQDTEEHEAEPRSSARFEKTVVYETDAETDSGDSDDALPRPSNPPDQQELGGDEKSSVPGSDNGPSSDDSQDLPPVPNSGTDLEGGTYSDLALPSDASLYYRRPPHYTQFPTGPVPLLNTQRIAELFPIDGSTQHGSNEASRSSLPGKNPSDVLCLQTQTQTQSQDPLKTSTQLVPGSSPLLRNVEVARDVDHSMRPPQESVVLVESSQPADKISQQKNGADRISQPRRLFSASEWLTDSVMASIPAPPWQLSQDSVGEPYPLPEG
jgi:hypothetical protein